MTPNSPNPKPSFGPQEWSSFLTERLGMPVEVTFGRARRQVLVAKPKASGWALRLNWGFGEAPEEVRQAVAAWMANGKRSRRASAILDAWINELGQRLGQEPRKLPRLNPIGAQHNLTELFGLVLQEDLTRPELEQLEALPSLSFGRSTRRARRSLQLGSYDAELHLIRIHPVLDQEAVPAWFVQFVLFHEVLHALYPPQKSPSGRTRHHPPAHVARERQHPNWSRAQTWQREQLGALLRSVRSGKPLAPSRGKRSAPGLIQHLFFD